MADDKKDSSNDIEPWLFVLLCVVLYHGCDTSSKVEKMERRLDTIERKLTDVHNWIDIERTKSEQ